MKIRDCQVSSKINMDGILVVLIDPFQRWTKINKQIMIAYEISNIFNFKALSA